jgi:hypothetical protein
MHVEKLPQIGPVAFELFPVAQGVRHSSSSTHLSAPGVGVEDTARSLRLMVPLVPLGVVAAATKMKVS